MRNAIALFWLTSACWGIAVGSAHAATDSFGSTGTEQTFTVPAGVSIVHVVAVGGLGGANYASIPVPRLGGLGAVATADLPVTVGEVLYVEVGGNGTPGDPTTSTPGKGGFNGGGNGGSGAGGGGGASDVRTVSDTANGTLASRLIVAGGGGGAGGLNGGNAGNPADSGGGAGTATAGGAGGFPSGPALPGGAGTLGVGGDGGTAGSRAVPGEVGGGGGGGLYGGGGGGGAGPNCSMYGCGSTLSTGGGGGSTGFGSGAVNTQVGADTTGNPTVTITYTPALPPKASAGKPTVHGKRMTVPVGCTGGSGATCNVKATLSVTEIVKSGHVTAIAAKAKVVVLGTATATVGANKNTTVSVSLNGSGRQLLARFRVLRVKLIITQPNVSGNANPVASEIVTFKANKHLKRTEDR